MVSIGGNVQAFVDAEKRASDAAFMSLSVCASAKGVRLFGAESWTKKEEAQLDTPRDISLSFRSITNSRNPNAKVCTPHFADKQAYKTWQRRHRTRFLGLRMN